MQPEIIAAIIGAGAGILSGGLTAWVSFYIHRKADVSLEIDEIRRRKIEIIFQIIGSKYILADTYRASPEEVRVFNTAMSLFPILFSDSEEVSRSYDTYLGDKSSQDKLLALLRVAAKTVGVNVLDSVLSKTLPASAVISEVYISAIDKGPRVNSTGSVTAATHEINSGP